MNLIKKNLVHSKIKKGTVSPRCNYPSCVLNMNVINNPFQTMLSNPENGHLFKKTMNC